MLHYSKANAPGKFIRLFGTILLAALTFALILTLFFFIMRLFFEALRLLPWLDYLYVAFLICVPAAIFVTAFVLFFKRTLHHPSLAIRYLSLSLFAVMILIWAVIFVLDIISFFRFQFTNIGEYYSFNILFLFINILVIFFTGIMQALTTPPEKDWMERRNSN